MLKQIRLFIDTQIYINQTFRSNFPARLRFC